MVSQGLREQGAGEKLKRGVLQSLEEGRGIRQGAAPYASFFVLNSKQNKRSSEK